MTHRARRIGDGVWSYRGWSVVRRDTERPYDDEQWTGFWDWDPGRTVAGPRKRDVIKMIDGIEDAVPQ